MLRTNQWPHNVALLRPAARNSCSTAMASMSSGEQVDRVLEAIGLTDPFDLVLFRRDVECPKPDLEIHQLSGALLQTSPGQCLVIGVSPAGVQAAAAG